MKNFKLLSLVGFILLTSLVSCTKGRKVVAIVGETKLRQSDVDARMKLMKEMNPNITSEAALNQLIQSYTNYEILKLKKIQLGKEEIEKEWEMRKKMGERNPKMAEAFKAAEKDPDEFKRVMIIPMMADRMMFSQGYQQDLEFHKMEKEKADKMFEAVKANPSKFDELVTKEGGLALTGVIEEKAGLKWKTDKKLPPGFSYQGPGAGMMFKKKYLEKTNPGSLVPELIDDRMSYMVLLHEKGSNPKGTMSLKAGVIPKKPIGDWMREQQGKVKVERM